MSLKVHIIARSPRDNISWISPFDFTIFVRDLLASVAKRCSAPSSLFHILQNDNRVCKRDFKNQPKMYSLNYFCNHA